ncbi:hypothetical protein GGX14DRAFT_604450 [Mycena pura]|uniref:Uncharacterized protein n=1 Tax=Mycena pura TaxID=153505 RepID=A0AAD6VLC5_9AGAR|nr:hypothetical protein GGX14DRAFT_604450 [Mycena pura]
MLVDHELLCAALDALGIECNAKTKDASRWCPRHNEERIKLYINYKAQHSALDAIPEKNLCRSVGAVKACTSLETVKTWNKTLMAKYQILNRYINAREYFTERFFGNDMARLTVDFGHKSFWHSLLKQLHKTETLLAEVEQRACILILEAQNAMWVLASRTEHSEVQDDCTGHDDALLPTLRRPKPCPTDITDVEDPLDVALREKRNLLWEKIKTRLARYCAPIRSKFYAERLEVIYACVRRAICTDTKLLLVAQNYQTVTALLADVTLDVAVVEKLWQAIRFLDMHHVRAAVDDVLRPQNSPVEYIVVLDGRVYKSLSGESFPFHAWGHMTALFMCYTCVRRVCKTVDEVVTLTRFAVLDMQVLNQSALKYEFAYPDSRLLSLCGFIPNSIETYPRSVLSKCNVASSGKPHWQETEMSYVLFAGLSLTDPKAQLFVNACLRDPELMVIARKGTAGLIMRSTTRAWGERVRHANTRAGLQTAEWDTSYFKDSVLEEARPKVFEEEVIKDCFQVVLVDGGEGSMEDFVAKIAHIWLEKVYNLPDMVTLTVTIAIPLLASGEIEIDLEEKKRTPNRETDLLASYKQLWGKAPAELADDDIHWGGLQYS